MGGGGDIGSVDITNPSDPASRAYLTNRYVWGLRMNINTADHLGFEVGYAYQRTAFKVGTSGTAQGFAIHTVAPMVLFHFTSVDARVRPFVQGGGGFASFCPPGSSISRGGCSRKFEFAYGAGVKIKTTDHFLIRFDYREHQSGKPFDLPGQDGLLRRSEFTVGVSYLL